MTEQQKEELSEYVDRKVAEFLATLDGAAVVRPRETVRLAACNLVAQVMRDMTIHLSHPQPPQERT